MGGLIRIGILAFVLGAALLFLVAGNPVLAQGGASCEIQLQQALSAIDARCGSVAPGELCIGEGVEIQPKDGVGESSSAEWSLSAVDRVVSQNRLGEGESFGIGLLRAPGLGEGEQLTALLFGEASLAVEPGLPVAPLCNAVSIGSVNVRAEPSTSSAILGQLKLGEAAPITARMGDSAWWRILWQGEPAWVFAELAPADCDPGAMLILDPTTQELTGGMPAPEFQNVRFESGFGTSVCSDEWSGGLLLQSEQDRASWELNGLTLHVEGTILVQGNRDDILAFSVLEGELMLLAGGVSRVAASGQLIRVPMRDGAMAGLPGPALDVVTYDEGLLPLSLLPRSIDVPGAVMQTPAVSAEADLICSPLTQLFTVMADGTRSLLTVLAQDEQTLRISARFQGSGQLGAVGPSGIHEVLAEGPEVLAGEVAVTSPGVHTVVLEGATSETLFGVTCNLPPGAPVPIVQSCEDVNLHWEAVSGNEVRFAAQILSVLSDEGQQVGQTEFGQLRTVQVAGPLDLTVPQDTTYIVAWDGDPFNVANVEVVCLSPEAGSAE